MSIAPSNVLMGSGLAPWCSPIIGAIKPPNYPTLHGKLCQLLAAENSSALALVLECLARIVVYFSLFIHIPMHILISCTNCSSASVRAYECDTQHDAKVWQMCKKKMHQSKRGPRAEGWRQKPSEAASRRLYLLAPIEDTPWKILNQSKKII